MLENEQKEEIKELRAASYKTRRATVDSLEEVLYEPFPVLDHGFIRVIDYMGDDAAVVQAARVSYGKGTKKINEDKGLINYLMRHRHTTPFEMCEIKLHVKLPIFIARQWIRHRTANVNEYSARYSILDREFYIPAAENLAAQSVNNRQGRGDILTGEEAKRVLEILKNDSLNLYSHYEEMLNHDVNGNTLNENNQGLARELARMNLSLNYYTQWYWKTDLHNFMNFISLRADSHAQYEIRVYAEILLDILKKWVPNTYNAFVDYRKGAAEISAAGLKVIQRMIKGEKVSQEDSGMSKGEWREFCDKIGLEG